MATKCDAERNNAHPHRGNAHPENSLNDGFGLYARAVFNSGASTVTH